MNGIIRTIFRQLVQLCFVVTITVPVTAQDIKISVFVVPPVNMLLNQALSSGSSGLRVMVTNNSSRNYDIRLFGRVEQISPGNFWVQLKPDFKASTPIRVPARQTIPITSALLSQALGNFRGDDLETSGIVFNDFRDGPNYKLPEGMYRLCLYARNYNNDSIVSSQDQNPNNSFASNCSSTFNLCYKASAPQFTQPVNNFSGQSSISVIRPVSPVVFTWTPPQATCALVSPAFNYELEIREILDDQTITDAINNPFVFRKTSLPSSTFLFDINLYRDVLRLGKKYAVRVKANSTHPTSPIIIDNNGYSRIEAFQYGEALAGDNITINSPDYYYLPFSERRTSYWDDQFAAFVKGTRKDTLVPVKEYIGFRLLQNGIAYSLDAIELFLSLNSDLANVKEVKLSHLSKMPELPKVGLDKQQKFEQQHLSDLQPDVTELSKFTKLIDTLNSSAFAQRVPESAKTSVNELIQSLNGFGSKASTVNRVSLNFINELVSELLYVMKTNSGSFNKNDLSHLQDIVTSVKELALSALVDADPKPVGDMDPFYSHPHTVGNHIFFARFEELPASSTSAFLASPSNALLPFDVVVYRRSNAPNGPITNAPDLNETYRIFYTLKGLYNYKNPEINAKNIGQLASTTNVSLPLNSGYKFWSLNMLDHKLTKPQDIDVQDLFLKSRKDGSSNKKLTILLKVD